MKKSGFTIVMICLSFWVQSQNTQVASKVYKWSESEEQKTKYGTLRKFFEGSTTDLNYLDFRALKIQKGKVFDGFKTDSLENLIIIKEGFLELILNDKSTFQLSPGSIAMVFPGDKLSVKNSSDGSATFYLMSYNGRVQDFQRSRNQGVSFVKIWEEIKFEPHDRGGVRNFYNLPTVMTEYFEMHVTNLNGLIKSHEPHTHRAAEIVLMVTGNTEMQIGEEFFKGTDGDVYFLGSEVPHAIENKEPRQCMYFAFQWN